MPETFRSFHYWQPVPRWRLLPWLANSGNLAMSVHAGKRNRNPERKWKEWGRGGENCLGDEPPLKTTLKVHARTPQSNGTWNSEACAYAKTVNF